MVPGVPVPLVLRGRFFSSSNHRSLARLLSYIIDPAYLPPACSEIDIATFLSPYHEMLFSALRALGLAAVAMSRNVADHSMTVKGNRPDLCVWLENLLVYKAEDKATRTEISVAELELLNKMAYNALVCGSVPFLLCNCSGADAVQFVAIDPGLRTSHRLTRVLYLTRPVTLATRRVSLPW